MSYEWTTARKIALAFMGVWFTFIVVCVVGAWLGGAFSRGGGESKVAPFRNAATDGMTWQQLMDTTDGQAWRQITLGMDTVTVMKVAGEPTRKHFSHSKKVDTQFVFGYDIGDTHVVFLFWENVLVEGSGNFGKGDWTIILDDKFTLDADGWRKPTSLRDWNNVKPGNDGLKRLEELYGQSYADMAWEN